MKKEEALRNKRGEWIIWAAFIAALVTIHYFHEPWFDEAQSWQIARCASIKDILFVIPHDEGHPPLWWLLLVPFAKSGLSYELSFTLVTVLINGTAVWLILFKSPFSKIVRFMLPFTYFIFYQTGVVSRPYGLMILFFILLALAYPKRNEKPWIYVLIMALMCFLDAYGILFSFGLCLAWLCELIIEKRSEKKNVWRVLVDTLKDIRMKVLLLLATAALFVTVMIIPSKDAFAYQNSGTASVLVRSLYMFLISPADAVISNVLHRDNILSNIELDPKYAIPAAFLGILILIILLEIAYKRKMILTLALPLFVFDLFGIVVYFSIHHLSILFGFFIFFLWISERTCPIDISILQRNNVLKISTNIKGLLAAVCRILLCSFLLLSVYWTIAASIYDVIYPYSAGKQIAEIINENNLSRYVILSQAGTYYNTETSERSISTNIVAGVDSLPWQIDNPFVNLNLGSSEKGYIIYKNICDLSVIKEWAFHGEPDFLLGDCGSELTVMSNGVWSMDDYVPVVQLNGSYMWKDTHISDWYYFYIRKDLLTEFPQFHEVEYNYCFVPVF